MVEKLIMDVPLHVVVNGSTSNRPRKVIGSDKPDGDSVCGDGCSGNGHAIVKVGVTIGVVLCRGIRLAGRLRIVQRDDADSVCIPSGHLRGPGYVNGIRTCRKGARGISGPDDLVAGRKVSIIVIDNRGIRVALAVG